MFGVSLISSSITFVEEQDRLIMKQVLKKAFENHQTIKNRVISQKVWAPLFCSWDDRVLKSLPRKSRV